MYARGLSTRDVEEALTDATGECILGRSAVSELTDRLWEEYEAFCARDLSGFEVIYMIARFEGQYPAAMKSSADDLEASLAHLRLPLAHRRCARTTNLIERSCLKLAFGALERAARRWQRLTITELEQRQLDMLRKELEPRTRHRVTNAKTHSPPETLMPEHFCSRFRT